MVKSVLFVCSGNTCRSVMAEYLLEELARKAGYDLTVSSAGTRAFPGDRAADNALEVLQELAIRADEHRSRRVQPYLLAEHDLILAMTEGHKIQLLEIAPELADRIYVLKEYGRRKAIRKEDLASEIEKDIQDPFGQSLEVYRNTRDEIAEELEVILQAWTEGLEEQMKLVIGSDHGGFQAKEQIIAHLQENGYLVEDYGTFSEESCDYPDIAQKVGQAVSSKEFDLGILICGTGIGVSIAANKVKGIRAALCQDTYSAKMAREHNDSNILCLGARVTGLGLMLEIVDSYLDHKFAGGRHLTRVEKIEEVN